MVRRYNWYSEGQADHNLQNIGKFIFCGRYGKEKPGDLGIMLMIAGASGKEGGLIGLLELLQSPKEAE